MSSRGRSASSASGRLDSASPDGARRCSYTRRLLRYARKDRASKLRRLLRRHCTSLDLRATDRRGLTALHLAARAGSAACAEALLRAGADAAAATPGGDTAAHLAAAWAAQRPQVLLSFSAAGVPLHCRDAAGRTARDVAARVLADAASVADARRRAAAASSAADAAAAAAAAAGERSRAGHAARSLWDEEDEEGGDPYYAQWEGLAEDLYEEKEERQAPPAAAGGPSWERSRHTAREATLPMSGNAFERWKEAEVRRKAAEAESARILRQEEARDRAWRAGVAGQGLAQQRAAYMAAWAALEGGASLLGEADLPFPTAGGQEAQAGLLLLAGVPPAKQRKALRDELLRWHPDKFEARFGARLLPEQRERVQARVNAMSQAVATLFQDLKN